LKLLGKFGEIYSKDRIFHTKCTLKIDKISKDVNVTD